MAASGTAGSPGAGPPPFDGSEAWLEHLPIRFEQLARLLMSMAGADRSGPAAPEVLTASLQFRDSEVTIDDVIEGLLALAGAGFVRLLTVLGVERFVLAPMPDRYIPVTNGKGEGGRAGAREGASGPTPPRPNGAREPLRAIPPRFCPEHMPNGTLKSCGACARRREMRAAWVEQNEVRKRDAYRDTEETPDDQP